MHIVPYRADGITAQVDSAQVRANLAQTGIDSWEGTSEDSSLAFHPAQGGDLSESNLVVLPKSAIGGLAGGTWRPFSQWCFMPVR